MVKKTTIIFAILAMLAFGACTCWGYTASKWPVPGIPNTVFGPGSGLPGNIGYGGYGAYGGYGGYGGFGGYGGYGYPGYYDGYGGYGGYGGSYQGQGWHR
jgi:hypothetical protein